MSADFAAEREAVAMREKEEHLIAQATRISHVGRPTLSGCLRGLDELEGVVKRRTTTADHLCQAIRAVISQIGGHPVIETLIDRAQSEMEELAQAAEEICAREGAWSTAAYDRHERQQHSA